MKLISIAGERLVGVIDGMETKTGILTLVRLYGGVLGGVGGREGGRECGNEGVA